MKKSTKKIAKKPAKKAPKKLTDAQKQAKLLSHIKSALKSKSHMILVAYKDGTSICGGSGINGMNMGEITSIVAKMLSEVIQG